MKPWFALLCCAAWSAQADVLIDVRSADEFAQEHIAGAYLLPVQEIAAISAQVPDKNEAIYLYCRSGARAERARQTLQAMGYSQVHNLGSVATARQWLSENAGIADGLRAILGDNN